MARPYWSGQIQISLVSFGVKLFVATEAKSQVRFHQISRWTGERVRHQKVLASAVEEQPEEAAAPVEKSDIIKGYEYRKGEYMMLEPKEIEHLRIPSKKVMEVAQFSPISEIPPEFFEKPYFVAPEDDAQAEAFATVRRALLETKKAAISKIAFGGREHLVAIVPEGKGDNGGMMAYILRYAAELRKPEDYFRDIKKSTVHADSLALAKELIQRKTAKFDAGKFTDTYETALKELVEAKMKHLPLPQEEETQPTRGKVVNLMDALRKSVEGRAKKPPAREATTRERKGLSLVAKKPAKTSGAHAKRRSA